LKILALIPARCGSKGIKDKNIVDICNKPLIAYTIEQALALKQVNLVNEVIVSTDCEKIANVAKIYGANVPFLRPKNISGDNAKSISFIIHALEFYSQNNIEFDAVLLLQPTSPLRNVNLLNEAINKFIKYDAESLISVYKEEYINDLVMYKANNNQLIPLNPLHNVGVRRQEHGAIFVRNGAIYLTKCEYLKHEKKIISDSPLMIEMTKSQSINIDTEEDLVLLRKILCK
jgi:CMP-N-acetylneuraminic acid synthetase